MVEKSFNVIGQVIEVGSNFMKIKLAEDFILQFAFDESQKDIYLNALNKDIPVTIENTLDEIKNKIGMNFTFRVS